MVRAATYGVLLSIEPAIAALTGWLILSQSLTAGRDGGDRRRDGGRRRGELDERAGRAAADRSVKGAASAGRREAFVAG